MFTFSVKLLRILIKSSTKLQIAEIASHTHWQHQRIFHQPNAMCITLSFIFLFKKFCWTAMPETESIWGLSSCLHMPVWLYHFHTRRTFLAHLCFTVIPAQTCTLAQHIFQLNSVTFSLLSSFATIMITLNSNSISLRAVSTLTLGSLVNIMKIAHLLSRATTSQQAGNFPF